MKTNLLKINAMKRFSRWLDTNRVATYLWDAYNPTGKIYLGLEKRQKESEERDKFVTKRIKIRPNWTWLFMRQNHYHKAESLLNYISRRYLRSKK